MNPKTIVYWITTALVGLAFLAAGIGELTGAPWATDVLRHLGYPVYFAAILGTWKILGALALLAPGLPLLKEWAYAGVFFDLTGAAISHTAKGDEAARIMTPLIIVAVLVASYMLRPESRRLGAKPSQPPTEHPAGAMRPA